MKKLLFLILVVVIAFLYINRHRVYVRDPLASLTRNGVTESGAQVYINHSNEVLIENDNPPLYTTLVQHDLPVGTPARIYCLHWLICMTTEVHPPLLGSVGPADIMTDKLITYRDRDGRTAIVTLK